MLTHQPREYHTFQYKLSPSLKFLCAAIFILTGVPRLNISIGPIPVYGIDLCILGAIYYGGLNRAPHLGSIPRAGLVMAILFLILLSETIAMMMTGTYVQTPYMAGRMCLAIALFYLINNLVTTKEELQAVLKAAVAGMLVTSFLMTMTSLPGTRGVVSWLFEIRQLTPSGEDFFRLNAGLERGTRGQSLVGYNIISAWFVALIWPLSIALYRSELTIGAWRNIARIGCFLAPFGVLFAYSRGALLGMLLMIAALLLFGEGKLKVQIATAIIVVTSIIGFFGWNSDVFYFERIERRTQATMENPFSNDMENERFGSYIEPFQLAELNPTLIVLGEGLTIDRVRGRGQWIMHPLFPSPGWNIADHSVFAMATIKYGMLAAFCYLALHIFTVFAAYSEASYSRWSEGLARYFPQLAFASAFGMTAWVAFDKGIILQPRGAMMFLFIIGLINVSSNLRNHAYAMKPTEDEEASQTRDGN